MSEAMVAMQDSQPLLRLEQIRKSFGGVTVLEDVDLEVTSGQVHALVGENGAGKSTLMKIAGGVHQPDAGRLCWQGRPVRLRDPRQAHDLGISFVHQELMLVPQLSVGENIFLGRHPARRKLLGWVRWGEIGRRAAQLLSELGHSIDPARPVGQLSVGEQQLVEIARALAFRARLIIMDEPTAPLSEHEVERLFHLIEGLKRRGVSVVYISHRLKEIYRIADVVTVLRDGRHVLTRPVSETSAELLVRSMVGRDISEHFGERRPHVAAEEALRVERLTARGKFREVSFSARRGEIVGLAGLVGAGRTELLETLFGAGGCDSGAVYLSGEPVSIRRPGDAVRRGMALVADDRKAKGLVLTASVRFNVALAGQRRPGAGWLIRAAREKDRVTGLVRELRVKITGLEQPVLHLSGGNQQKIVLAKWLLAGAGIFLLDEPTRGIDVGSKAEIYALIRRLAARGAAIVLASSELAEILHLADRVVVMHRGRVAGELERAEASEESIMRLAIGGGAQA
jgi:ribose transport system ATP-binding protein